jgi:hypothetical protein
MGVETAALMGGNILGSLIEGGVNLYIFEQQKKMAGEQNRMLGRQYEQERTDRLASERWQQNFAKDQQAFTEHQQNLANMRSWAKDFENTVNRNQELKNNLVAIWNKSRSG